MSRLEFSNSTKKEALKRQKNKCAACGEKISMFGKQGQEEHRFGEIAHAHHMLHCQSGGDNSLENCVILCQSCHYTAHNGGDYRNKEDFLNFEPADFEFFYG